MKFSIKDFFCKCSQIQRELWRGCSSDTASSCYFRPIKVTEHVTSRVSGGEFKTK